LAWVSPQPRPPRTQRQPHLESQTRHRQRHTTHMGSW
jgi:hypothetical protein